MTTPNIVNVEKFEVLPNNQPSNNIYSFRGGTPIISFVVPAQAKYLRPSSVRINGKIRVQSSAGILPNNNKLKPASRDGSIAETTININPRIGVHSVFQNVVLSSEATNQSLESIRQYGRLVASLLSSTHSPDDYQCEKSVNALCTGVQTSTGALINNEVHFSIPLYCGLLMGGNPIPLSMNGINGLGINLELASDNQVLSGANAGDAGGAFYQLKDLSLSGDLLVPDDKGVQALSVAGSGAFQYNSYNSMYSVINAGDATQTYNLANSNVLSVVHNFIPVSHSNTYAQDGFTNGELQNTNASGTVYNAPVTLKKVSFSRGGVKLGLDYVMDVEDDSSIDRPESQVNVQYLNAFKPYMDSSRFLNQKNLLSFGGADRVPWSNGGRANAADLDFGLVDTPANVQNGLVVDLGVKNFGIGIALDRVSDVGMNFKGQSYSTRIQSTLDGKSPNAIFTFIKAKNILSYSPNGITVSN